MSITSIAAQIRTQRGLQPAEVVELLRAMAASVNSCNQHLRETREIVMELDCLSDLIEDSYCPVEAA